MTSENYYNSKLVKMKMIVWWLICAFIATTETIGKYVKDLMRLF